MRRMVRKTRLHERHGERRVGKDVNAYLNVSVSAGCRMGADSVSGEGRGGERGDE